MSYNHGMETVAGQVVSIERDRAGGAADVVVDAAAGCSRCASGRGCGAALFGARGGARRLCVALPPNVAVAVGDRVTLALDSRGLLGAAVIVYGWPLAGAAAGALVAALDGRGDAAAVLAALAGMAAGGFLARRRLCKAGCLRTVTPRILT